MKLEELKEEILEAMFEDAVENYEPSSFSFSYTADTNDGYIDCYASYCEYNKTHLSVEVIINHDNGNEGCCDNLATYLEKAIAENFSLDDIEERVRDLSEDEWQRNGFADEADYNRYRYGNSFRLYA